MSNSNNYINFLAVKYVKTHEELIFNDLYNAFSIRYENHVTNFAKKLGGDKHEAQATYEDSLLKALEAFDPSKGRFENNLNKIIYNGKMDKLGSVIRTKKAESISLDDTLNIEARLRGNIVVEERYIESEKKVDQLQLIDEVLKTTGNEKVKKAIKLMLNGYSLNQAAVTVGICHKTLRRNFERIRSGFDEYTLDEIALLIA